MLILVYYYNIKWIYKILHSILMMTCLDWYIGSCTLNLLTATRRLACRQLNCFCERGLSKLSVIKTKIRTTMKKISYCLSSYMILPLQQDIIDGFRFMIPHKLWGLVAHILSLKTGWDISYYLTLNETWASYIVFCKNNYIINTLWIIV